MRYSRDFKEMCDSLNLPEEIRIDLYSEYLKKRKERIKIHRKKRQDQIQEVMKQLDYFRLGETFTCEEKYKP